MGQRPASVPCQVQDGGESDGRSFVWMSRCRYWTWRWTPWRSSDGGTTTTPRGMACTAPTINGGLLLLQLPTEVRRSSVDGWSSTQVYHSILLWAAGVIYAVYNSSRSAYCGAFVRNAWQKKNAIDGQEKFRCGVRKCMLFVFLRKVIHIKLGLSDVGIHI